MQDQTAALLTGAARAGNEACLALLSTDRFVQEINRLGVTGTNALHIAVWRNNLALVEALLEAGACTDVPDKESGWSALHRALYFGNLRIAAALLAANTSLTAPDWRGRSPLDLLSQDLRCYLSPTGPGDVFSWGAGTNYALGTGSTEPQVAPARIDTLHGKRVISLSAAKFHSAAVTEDGFLYTWGFGRGGRLGHPGAHLHSGESAIISPRLVAALGKRQVVAVAAAKHHTILCTSAGEVWAMGSNRHGQLGLSNAADTQPEPRRVSALRSRVIAIAAANKHSVAVTAAGEVYSWGSNCLGQLGYGTFDSGSSTAPRLVEALKGRVVVAAAAAKRHTLALTADGDIFTWGHRGVSPRRIQLAGSRDATASDGKALRFHRGHADVVRPEAIAICAGAAHSTALTGTGVVLSWRSADPALIVQEVGGELAGKRVVSLSAGKYRTAVVTDDGNVYCWEGRSDFFPAEGRQSGSGSKKTGTLSSAGGMLSGGTPKHGRPIPSSIFGSSPLGPRGGISSDFVGSGGAHGAGSYGSGNRPKYGNGGSGSFLERVYTQKMQQQREGNTAAASSIAPGSVGGGTGLSVRPETPLSAARAASVGIDAFASIVPEKVVGLKRAGVVAVGEKHSLAVQRWSAVQLEELPVLPWLKPSIGNDIAAEWEDDGASDAQEEENSSGIPYTQSSPQKVDHLNTDDASVAGASTTTTLPSLQQLCEEAVGQMLVDPRTALQILEYADLAGAEVLKSYCLAVAVCNLDAVLVEARGAFEELPPHLLAELERVFKGQQKSNRIGGSGTADSIGGTVATFAVSSVRRALDIPENNSGEAIRAVDDASVLKMDGPRWHLQPGLRPTAARAALGDVDDESGVLNEDDAGLSGCGAFSPLPLRGESSFKDLNTAATEAAEHRLRRTLAKKMQQIENLEAKSALDPQQRAKVAQKPVVLSAVAALDAGTAPEEVQAMLQAAAAAIAEQATASSFAGASGSSPPHHSTTPTNTQKHYDSAKKDGFEGGSKSSASKNTRARRRQSEKSVLTSEISGRTALGSSISDTRVHDSNRHLSTSFSGAASPSASLQVAACTEEVTSKGAGRPPTPTHVVGFKTTSQIPPSSEKIVPRVARDHGAARSVEKPPRKGALSMFLRGELDNPNGGGAIQPKSPAGPAWGGNIPTPAASTSLKSILSEEQQRGGGTPPPIKPSSTIQERSSTLLSYTSKAGGSGNAGKMPLASFLTGGFPTSTSAVGGEKVSAWGSSFDGGGGSRIVGNSPPSSRDKSGRTAVTVNSSGKVLNSIRKPSLREIQEDQERKKAAALGQQLPLWGSGSSPPAASRPMTSSSSLTASLWASRVGEVNAGGGGAGGGGSNSPRVGGAAAAAAAAAGAAGGGAFYGSSPGASATILLGTSPSGRAFFASPAPQSKWYVPEDEEHERRRIKSLAAIQTEERELQELAKLFCDESEKVLEEIDNAAGGRNNSHGNGDRSSTPGRGGRGRGKRGGRGGGGGRVATIWVVASFAVQGIESSGVHPAVLTFFANSLFALYLPIYWISLKIQNYRTGHALTALALSSPRGQQQEARALFPSNFPRSDVDDDNHNISSNIEAAGLSSSSPSGLSNRAVVIIETATLQLFRAACVVAPLWFLAQLTFNSSLKLTTVTSNTILSSASSLFTFFFSVIYLSEKFTLMKLGCIGALIVGTAMVTLADAGAAGGRGGGGDETEFGGEGDQGSVAGDMLCLLSSVIYGAYTVAIRRMLGEDEGVAMTLFFGFMGGIIFIGVGPILAFAQLLHANLGTLTWASFGMVLAKGLLDNVLSDYLWARAILLVGPTLATAGLSMQVPIAIVLDAIFHNPRWMHSLGTAVLTFLGGTVILVGFFALTASSSADEDSGVHGETTILNRFDNNENNRDGGGGGDNGRVERVWERGMAKLEAELEGIEEDEYETNNEFRKEISDGGGGGLRSSSLPSNSSSSTVAAQLRHHSHHNQGQGWLAPLPPEPSSL
ncbi:hypothetical protein Ndes2437A_g05967 [Nannochloris sp. 'desiccata']